MGESGGSRGGGGEGGSGGKGASDNWVLATIDAWILAGRCKEEIVLKVMKSFSLEDMKAAALHLRKGEWCVPQISVPQEARAGADFSRELAETVFDGLTSIQNQAPLKVVFWVASQDLLKVPGVGPFPDQLEEPEVAARLGAVDKQLQCVLDKLENTQRLESTVAGLVKTVDSLKQQMKEQEQAAAARSQQQVAAGPSLQQSWASVAGRGRLMSRTGVLQAGVRGRSASTKRARTDSGSESESGSRTEQEVKRGLAARAAHPHAKGSVLSQDLAAFASSNGNGFTEVLRRKNRGGGRKMGSSTVHAEGGIKPPYAVFLSGTSPATTVEIVKEKLGLCADAARGEGQGDDAGKLTILNVVEVKLNIPEGETPRHRCWKVTVPPECAAHMAKAEAYPSAWSWRKWNNGPRKSLGDRQGDGALNVGA